MKLYDKENKRLVVFEKAATSQFWDKHWQKQSSVEKVKLGDRASSLKRFTARFLKPGARILEGGCGPGQNVYGLRSWGYDAYGVDFGAKTIGRTKKEFPYLNLSLQDVRKLSFADNLFDGYWSLGVVEHFWEGYDEILKEAERVIKPRGYLFLTFPYMSPLRRLKAKLGFYRDFNNDDFLRDSFYEYILNKDRAKKDVERFGFGLILGYPFGATKGLKDEVLWLKPFLQKIYASQNILGKGIRFLNSILFSKIAGHMVLLVFQKNETGNLQSSNNACSKVA